MASVFRKPVVSKKKSKTFTDNETEILVSEWFKYPCHYDKSHNNSHEENEREVEKGEIADTFKMTSQTSLLRNFVHLAHVA